MRAEPPRLQRPCQALGARQHPRRSFIILFDCASWMYFSSNFVSAHIISVKKAQPLIKSPFNA
jgi:hypothetical protein